jgi:hypothetical protein
VIPDQLISVILQTFAGLGGVALVVLLLWIFLPEKIEKWAILLHRGLAYFSERHERKYIAGSIENRLRRWKERLLKVSKGILPYDLKIRWVDIDVVESELKEGKLIVKMKNHRNQSKNFAFAVKEFVPNTLIPKARQYVDPLIMGGIDYVVSKSMLAEDTRALQYFSDETQDKFSDPTFRQIVNELDTIHEEGKLTRILLPEYSTLSILYPQDPNRTVQVETANFEKMLFNFITREKDQTGQLDVNGSYIQSAIIPVAKSSTLLTSGVEPHLNAIKKRVEGGTTRFYIVAARSNIVYARQVYEEACSVYGLTKNWEDEYKGLYQQRRNKLYCACLEQK